MTIPFEASRPEVLRRLAGGARLAAAPAEVPSGVGSLVDQALAWAAASVRPQAVYRTGRVARRGGGGGLELSGPDWGRSLELDSRALAGLLERCGSATIFAVTLGPGLDQEVRARSEQGRLAAAVALDAVGSQAVEDAAGWLVAELSRVAARAGLGPTARFSPGYADLGLAAQGPWVACLEAGAIGISVGSGYALSPRKTITAVIGWEQACRPGGRNGAPSLAPPEASSSGCQGCAARSCPHRREG